VNTKNYFIENGCESIIKHFFSHKAIEQRRNRYLHDLRDINFSILREYRKLRRVYALAS
jgi:hypothetical protein